MNKCNIIAYLDRLTMYIENTENSDGTLENPNYSYSINNLGSTMKPIFLSFSTADTTYENFLIMDIFDDAIIFCEVEVVEDDWVPGSPQIISISKIEHVEGTY